MLILVVNAGSSSHKLCLYDLHDNKPTQPLWKGALDWGNKDSTILSFQTAEEKVEKTFQKVSIEEELEILLKSLYERPKSIIKDLSSIERIGHRVVHGGQVFEQPTLITSQVKEQIRNLIPLAPLHNPENLQGIELMEKIFPSIPQIAVFDTAFHTNMPDIVKTYPVPYVWKEDGIQRYGFHGPSHQYCAERAAHLLKNDHLKIVNCHLGNGVSLCAMVGGKSVNTTMGFTPMEGLMMGSRSGSIDPGIILYLLREGKQSIDSLDSILNFESGLKGICGFSDMREILQSKDEKAKLAFDMFIYHLKFYLGAMITYLEGIDVIIFTAGIGENASQVREEVCHSLSFMGIEIDAKLNANCKPDQDIAKKSSKARILVIHTEEEWMIAKACLKYEV